MGRFTVARHMAASFTPQILASRAFIRLSGENVMGFLHNLVTADVQALSPGAWAYGALLSPQGKIQHELFITPQEDGALIDCVRNQRGDLLRKLTMYRLRARLEIVAEDGLQLLVTPPEQGLDRFTDPRHAGLGTRQVVAAGGASSGLDDYDMLRLTLGIADGDADIGVNEHFPHEANFDLLHGVSFRKGCYVGQEVVSRMQHRGTARNRMLPVMLEGPAPDHRTAIMTGEVTVGTLLSSCRGRGLALIRLDRLAEARQPLLSGGVRVHVQKPAWMTAAVVIPAEAQ
jgi:hypothetical protein